MGFNVGEKTLEFNIGEKTLEFNIGERHWSLTLDFFESKNLQKLSIKGKSKMYSNMNNSKKQNQKRCPDLDCHDVAEYIEEIEQDCANWTFKECMERSGYPPFCVKRIKSYPSEIIQARLEYDVLCSMDLTDLKPIQMQRLSLLKRDLITIIKKEFL